MNRNYELNKAQINKSDEFYTMYNDIEKEVLLYTTEFFNKSVYCNCDDINTSNFWKFFCVNFERLNLKKVIATCFSPDSCGYKYEYNGKQIKRIQLLENGSYDSSECLDILQNCDIVCTNPPFSKLRNYLTTLVDNNKKFLIIGNINNITCKTIFPLFATGSVWLGQSIHSGDIEFQVPDNYPMNAVGQRVDDNGNRYIRVKGVRWFTNIGNHRYGKKIYFNSLYNENIYQKYDNSDIINVSKTKNIPCDYKGLIGVPVTFFDFYDPKEYMIVGSSSTMAPSVIIDGKLKKNPQRFYINGKRLYERIVIKRL